MNELWDAQRTKARMLHSHIFCSGSQILWVNHMATSDHAGSDGLYWGKLEKSWVFLSYFVTFQSKSYTSPTKLQGGLGLWEEVLNTQFWLWEQSGSSWHLPFWSQQDSTRQFYRCISHLYFFYFYPNGFNDLFLLPSMLFFLMGDHHKRYPKMLLREQCQRFFHLLTPPILFITVNYCISTLSLEANVIMQVSFKVAFLKSSLFFKDVQEKGIYSYWIQYSSHNLFFSTNRDTSPPHLSV